MIWLIFGPPGSGKGTQARFISSEFGLTHLSTGEVLRAEAAEGSEEGRQVALLMKAGQLVPRPAVYTGSGHEQHNPCPGARQLLAWLCMELFAP